jgi:hypothetical protein
MNYFLFESLFDNLLPRNMLINRITPASKSKRWIAGLGLKAMKAKIQISTNKPAIT